MLLIYFFLDQGVVFWVWALKWVSFFAFLVLKQGQGSRTFVAHPYPKFGLDKNFKLLKCKRMIDFFGCFSLSANSICRSHRLQPAQQAYKGEGVREEKDRQAAKKCCRSSSSLTPSPLYTCYAGYIGFEEIKNLQFENSNDVYVKLMHMM